MAFAQRISKIKEASREIRGPTGQLTVAAAIPRIIILLGTILAGRLLPISSFDRLIYAISASATLQILLDPCVYIYLPLVAPKSSPKEWGQLWADGLFLQCIAGFLLATLSLALAIVTHASESGIVASLAVGVLAGLEGLARYARVEHQVREHFRKYAMIDILLSAGRLISFLFLIVHPSLDSFALGCSVACIIPIAYIVHLHLSFRCLPAPKSALRLFGKVWQYGLSTTFSGLQAQAPAVLLGIAGTIHAAAIYGFVSRLTQPTEMIPSAIAAVTLPAMVKASPEIRKRLFHHSLWQARVIGVVAGIGTVVGGYFVLVVSKQYSHSAMLTLIVLSAVLPIKFGNYQNSNATIVLGGIRFRLIQNACFATIAVAFVLGLAPFGPVVVALVILVVEILAAVSFAIHLRRQTWSTELV